LPRMSSLRWGAVGSAVSWGGMLETLECLFDIRRHLQMHFWPA
jgi:hypothetical protein